jgi:hypothetical protein
MLSIHFRAQLTSTYALQRIRLELSPTACTVKYLVGAGFIPTAAREAALVGHDSTLGTHGTKILNIKKYFSGRVASVDNNKHKGCNGSNCDGAHLAVSSATIGSW